MGNNIIRKSNSLVEAQYTLSLWEMRIFIKMLTLVKKSDTDFKEYTIELGEFIKEFNLHKNKNAYKLLREGARGLLTKIVQIPRKLEDGTIEMTETPLVAGVAHNIDKRSYIKLSFHPNLKRELLQLKDKFLMYEMKNILLLASPYAIRIYELTKQYARIGHRTFTVEGLKNTLELNAKYSRYTHLKQKVLLKSIEDINKNTDLELSFKEIKLGRRVNKIKFIIKKKKDVQAKDTKIGETDDLMGVLNDFGVTKQVASNWRKNYSEEHILDRIKYILNLEENGDVINNKAGYLNKLLSVPLKGSTSSKMSAEDVTKRVNAILYSRGELQQQIERKYGSLSQEAMNKVVQKMFPDKFS